MNVARESTKGPEPLTLTRTALGIPDSLRGKAPRSALVEQLLAKEKKRREHEAFYRTVVASYAWKVCLETLNLNEETPLAGFDYSA